MRARWLTILTGFACFSGSQATQGQPSPTKIKLTVKGGGAGVKSHVECDVCTPAVPARKPTSQNGKLTLTIVGCDPEFDEVAIKVVPINSLKFFGKEMGVKCRNDNNLIIDLPRS